MTYRGKSEKRGKGRGGDGREERGWEANGKRGERRRKERERKVGENTGKRLCACVQCGPARFTTQDPDPVLTVQPMPVSSQWKQLEAYDIVQSKARCHLNNKNSHSSSREDLVKLQTDLGIPRP